MEAPHPIVPLGIEGFGVWAFTTVPVYAYLLHPVSRVPYEDCHALSTI